MATAILIWNPDTDSIENYYLADHVHGTTGVCLKNPGGKHCVTNTKEASNA